MHRSSLAAFLITMAPGAAAAATCTDRSAALFSATGGSFDVLNVTLGPDRWVVTGETGKVASSTDFVTFTDHSAAAGFTASGTVAAACTDGTTWLLVGGQSGTSSYAVKTTNFTMFTSVDIGFGSNPASSCIWDGPAGGKVWMVVGNGTLARSSPDLVTWTTRSTTCSASEIFGVHYAASLWVVGGTKGCLSTSPDLVTWTNRAMSAGLGTGICGEFAHDGTQWILGGATAVMANGFLKTTSNFSSYTDRASAMGFGSEWVTALYWTGTHLLVGGGTNTTGPIFKTTVNFSSVTDDLATCMTGSGWASGVRVRAASKGSLIAAGNGELMEITQTVALGADVSGLAAVREGSAVRIAWRLGDPSSIATLQVERSAARDGPWAVLVDPIEPARDDAGHEYSALDAAPGDRPWYRVVVWGFDGTSTSSAPVTPTADGGGACGVTHRAPPVPAAGLFLLALGAAWTFAFLRRLFSAKQMQR